MSKPIALVQTSSATLPANGRKLITCIDVVGVLGCILPTEIGRDDVIRARNVKLSYEMAHSAITGQKSALAFVQGVAFCAVVFSHGNKSLAQLQAGAPAWVQSLLANVTQHFKCGAGNVTRASLETALDAGIKLTLALPAPAKAIKDTSNWKVIPSTIVDEDEPIDLATGRIKVHSLAFGHEAYEDRIRSTDAARIQSTFSQAEELERRKAIAREHAESQKEKECVDVVRMITELRNKDQAIALIRAMAEHFGYTLVDMGLPAKVAA